MLNLQLDPKYCLEHFVPAELNSRRLSALNTNHKALCTYKSSLSITDCAPGTVADRLEIGLVHGRRPVVVLWGFLFWFLDSASFHIKQTNRGDSLSFPNERGFTA